jgi:D-lactate dehydrogenase (cytochrome)
MSLIAFNLSMRSKAVGFRISRPWSSGAVSLLSELLPHVELSTNPYDLQVHGRGESHHPTALPWAVVMPRSVDDVVTIVKHCAVHQIPIIPYGAGTSVEGHVCALEGGISLDMTRMNSVEVLENDGIPDPVAVVGAGITRKHLNEALRHTGMQFVVDPGADATIGGMVACGASGTTAVRFGTMRENILALECVLPDGTIARCGTHALKSSAGYDLVSLMCGSEGTLGVITSVSVKLHPIPEHIMSAVCVFDNLQSAAAAVAALKLTNVPVARCELLDAPSVQAFNQYNKSRGYQAEPREVLPTLFFEFHGPSEASVQEQVIMTQSICVHDYGGSNFQFESDEGKRKALWSARHDLYYATLALRPGATGAIVTDCCVPLSKFANLISNTAQQVLDLNVVGPCFGHAGDGNLHCILPVRDDDNDEYLSRLHEVNDSLIRRTLEAGGTCTGERKCLRTYSKNRHPSLFLTLLPLFHL